MRPKGSQLLCLTGLVAERQLACAAASVPSRLSFLGPRFWKPGHAAQKPLGRFDDVRRFFSVN
jgi:hypothetical protein